MQTDIIYNEDCLITQRIKPLKMNATSLAMMICLLLNTAISSLLTFGLTICSHKIVRL